MTATADQADRPPFASKDDCPGCNAQRDRLGRLPIGACGSDCWGRPERRAS